MKRTFALIPVLAALLFAPLAAEAVEVAGVQVAETATLGGKTLTLNGAGLRKKVVFKVYVGALYVEQKSGDADAIVAADAPKLVRMSFLREVEKEKIMEAFREGFDKNSAAFAAEGKGKLAAFEKVLPAALKAGDVMTISYEPGKGATLQVGSGASATVEGKPFADALFRNYLGKEPADADLKAGMLGK